jgi:protease I
MVSFLNPLLFQADFTTFNKSAMGILQGKKVAILTENDFEEIEFTSPKRALEETGAEMLIVSPQKENVRGWDHEHWTVELAVDTTLQKANSKDYDTLLVPGGVINPDRTGVNPDCVDFAQQFPDAGKPVAAICHGPQLLIETATKYDLISFHQNRP